MNTTHTTDLWFADDFTVRDENRLTVATACDADQAEQIVSEHNSHAALLAALRSLTESCRHLTAHEQFGLTVELANARAAIAKAEGA